jgi:hypothetical protein
VPAPTAVPGARWCACAHKWYNVRRHHHQLAATRRSRPARRGVATPARRPVPGGDSHRPEMAVICADGLAVRIGRGDRLAILTGRLPVVGRSRSACRPVGPTRPSTNGPGGVVVASRLLDPARDHLTGLLTGCSYGLPLPERPMESVTTTVPRGTTVLAPGDCVTTLPFSKRSGTRTVEVLMSKTRSS